MGTSTESNEYYRTAVALMESVRAQLNSIERLNAADVCSEGWRAKTLDEQSAVCAGLRHTLALLIEI